MSPVYVRRSVQVARSHGLCLLCDMPLPAGDEMVILAYGGKRNDWGRAHVKCADESPYVLAMSTVNDISAAATREEPTHDSGVEAIDYVELQKGQYKGLDKYGVRLNGQVVWNTSDRKRAEGAVQFYEVVLHMNTKEVATLT